MDAFRSLRSDRSVGMAMGPIPWSSIERYATRHNLDNDELDTLETHIRAMESTLDQLENTQQGKDAR